MNYSLKGYEKKNENIIPLGKIMFLLFFKGGAKKKQ